MKKFLSIVCFLCALPWVICMLSLVPIASRTSCISDEFFARELLSFWMVPGFMFGPAVGWMFWSSPRKDSE